MTIMLHGTVADNTTIVHESGPLRGRRKSCNGTSGRLRRKMAVRCRFSVSTLQLPQLMLATTVIVDNRSSRLRLCRTHALDPFLFAKIVRQALSDSQASIAPRVTTAAAGDRCLPRPRLIISNDNQLVRQRFGDAPAYTRRNPIQEQRGACKILPHCWHYQRRELWSSDTHNQPRSWPG
jgi:hypothetical protein